MQTSSQKTIFHVIDLLRFWLGAPNKEADTLCISSKKNTANLKQKKTPVNYAKLHKFFHNS